MQHEKEAQGRQEGQITFGQWFRDYNSVPMNFTAEDISWTVIYNSHWPATPMLLMWLERYVKELDHAAEIGQEQEGH